MEILHKEYQNSGEYISLLLLLLYLQKAFHQNLQSMFFEHTYSIQKRKHIFLLVLALPIENHPFLQRDQ